MRKLSFILTVAMFVMAIIIIPIGISNIYLALQLGLLFECVSSLFLLCLFIAFCLFEIRELMFGLCVMDDEDAEQRKSGGERY